MSLHENIMADIGRAAEAMDANGVISPSAIALACVRQYGEMPDPRVEYAALEHVKMMARKFLAGRFEDAGADNAAYAGQGELFSGHLQERYPVPRSNGAEPVYKLLSLMTEAEIDWNLATLRKSARARLAHADALQAYKLQHCKAAA